MFLYKCFYRFFSNFSHDSEAFRREGMSELIQDLPDEENWAELWDSLVLRRRCDFLTLGEFKQNVPYIECFYYVFF